MPSRLRSPKVQACHWAARGDSDQDLVMGLALWLAGGDLSQGAAAGPRARAWGVQEPASLDSSLQRVSYKGAKSHPVSMLVEEVPECREGAGRVRGP